MPFVPVRRSGFAIAVLLATSAITARHPTATQQRSDQPTPLATVNMLVGGIERGDIDVVMRTFADDATVFFPGEPEKRATGTSEIRRGFAAVFARRRGVAPITPLDVQVQSFGDTAVVTAHLERPPGAPGTARRTFVLRRSGPSWLIVHLHASNVQGSSVPGWWAAEFVRGWLLVRKGGVGFADAECHLWWARVHRVPPRQLDS